MRVRWGVVGGWCVVACGVLLACGCGAQQAPCVETVRVVEKPVPVATACIPLEPAAETLSCGDLALREAELRALGKGERHPLMMAVEARLAQCSDRTPSRESCARLQGKRVELEAQGYGPAHPEVGAVNAQLALCRGMAP